MASFRYQLYFIKPGLGWARWPELWTKEPALAARLPDPPSLACGQGEFISTSLSIQRDLTPWSVKRSCAKVMEKLVSEGAQRLFLTSSFFKLPGEKRNCSYLSSLLFLWRGCSFLSLCGAFWKPKAVWEVILGLLYCCMRKSGRKCWCLLPPSPQSHSSVNYGRVNIISKNWEILPLSCASLVDCELFHFL